MKKIADILNTNVKTVMVMIPFCLLWTVLGIYLIIFGRTSSDVAPVIAGVTVIVLVWPLVAVGIKGIKWVE